MVLQFVMGHNTLGGRPPRARAKRILVAAGSAVTATTGALLRFVDPERPAVEILPVQGLHRACSIRVRHFDKAKATCAAGIPIRDQRHFFDRAMRSEEGTNAVLGCAERKIADVEFSHFRVLAESLRIGTAA